MPQGLTANHDEEPFRQALDHFTEDMCAGHEIAGRGGVEFVETRRDLRGMEVRQGQTFLRAIGQILQRLVIRRQKRNRIGVEQEIAGIGPRLHPLDLDSGTRQAPAIGLIRFETGEIDGMRYRINPRQKACGRGSPSATVPLRSRYPGAERQEPERDRRPSWPGEGDCRPSPARFAPVPG